MLKCFAAKSSCAESRRAKLGHVHSGASAICTRHLFSRVELSSSVSYSVAKYCGFEFRALSFGPRFTFGAILSCCGTAKSSVVMSSRVKYRGVGFGAFWLILERHFLRC